MFGSSGRVRGIEMRAGVEAPCDGRCSVMRMVGLEEG